MNRDVQTFFAPDGLFAADGDILLRRITGAERENYLDIYREKPELERLIALDAEGLFAALWDAFMNENDLNCAILAREDGRFCGYCGLQKYRTDAPELQIELLRAWRGQGVGFRALRLLMARYTHLTGQAFYIGNVSPGQCGEPEADAQTRRRAHRRCPLSRGVGGGAAHLRQLFARIRPRTVRGAGEGVFHHGAGAEEPCAVLPHPRVRGGRGRERHCVSENRADGSAVCAAEGEAGRNAVRGRRRWPSVPAPVARARAARRALTVAVRTVSER